MWRSSRVFKCVALAASLGVLISGFLAWRLTKQQDARGTLQSAIAAADAGQTENAIRLLDDLLRRNPEQPRALLYRAQLAREAGDVIQCRMLLQRVKTTHRKEAGTARFVEGTLMLESHRAKDAEALFRTACELNPAYAQPWERLANLYLTQLRGLELRDCLNSLRRIRPLTMDELIAYTEAGSPVLFPNEAIPVLRAYVNADPDDVPSRVALAAYLVLDERFTESIAIARAGLTSAPRNPQMIGVLVEGLVRSSRLSEVEDVVASLRVEEKTHPWLWRSEGEYALATGQIERAVSSLEQTLQFNPEDQPTTYRLGQALQRADQHEVAERLLKRSRQMEKLALAVFRLRMGDRQRLDLAANVVAEICESLLTLRRNSDALLWTQLALSWVPNHERLLEQQRLALSSLALRDDAIAVLPEIKLDLTRQAHKEFKKSNHPARDESPGTIACPIRFADSHSAAGLEFQYHNGRSDFKYLMETLGGGVAVLDYDNDGWPDLYFTQGGDLPTDPATNPVVDKLFRNTGHGTFIDVTEFAGLGDRQYSQGCVAGDYDNDGDADLIVANFGTNGVYRNNGDGTFTDVTNESGVGGEHWSTSLALADFDQDGDLDLYVVTYVVEPWKTCRTSTGQRSTCSPGNFQAEQDVLYLNQGDGTWEDVSETVGISAPDGKGLGILVSDFDDDGKPDIYVANDGTPNFLFHHRGIDDRGRPRFEEIGMTAGCAVNADGSAQAGMGIAGGDFNDDGRPDLYVTNFFQEYNTLYLNEGNLLFRDATREARLVDPTKPMLGFGTQAVDFDHDGLLDIAVTNGHIDDFRFRGEPWKMRPQLFWNRGTRPFVDASSSAGELFQSESLGRGMAVLDWNRDGRQDLVIVHQDRPVALLDNETPSRGHVLMLELHGRASNRDAIGASVRYSVGGRTHVRELAGGDGFFASNERRLALTAEDADQLDLVEIRWPSGHRQSWKNAPTGIVWVILEGGIPVGKPLLISP